MGCKYSYGARVGSPTLVSGRLPFGQGVPGLHPWSRSLADSGAARNVSGVGYSLVASYNGQLSMYYGLL